MAINSWDSFFLPHCYGLLHNSIYEICIFWQFSKKFNDKTLSSKHSLKQCRVTSSPRATLPLRIFSKCFYWPLASPGPCQAASSLPLPPPANRGHDRKLAFVIYHHHVNGKIVYRNGRERFYFSLTA